MLYLVRSDFRREINRESFLALLRLCGQRSNQIFERFVSEAPTPYAIAVSMRKATVSDKPLLIIGSYKQESLETTVRVVDTLRDELVFLRNAPVILIARQSEWRNYDPVLRGPVGVQLTHFVWDIKDGRMFVLPQTEGYGREEASALAEYLDHPKGKPSSINPRRNYGTQEMFIDEMPTSKMKVIPESAMPDARRPRDDEPTQEQRLEDSRSHVRTDPSQHTSKTDPQQPGFYSHLSPVQRGSQPPTGAG